MLVLTFIQDIMLPVHSLPTFHFVFQQSKMIDRPLQMQMIICIMTRPIFPRLPYSRPQLPSTSTSPSPIWHSGLSPYHYKLIILPTSVRRCYGCNCAFVDTSRQQPYNTIVKHVDRRIMQKDHGTHSYTYSPDFTNTYYHPISDHIRRRNPLFTGSVHQASTHRSVLSRNNC